MAGTVGVPEDRTEKQCLSHDGSGNTHKAETVSMANNGSGAHTAKAVSYRGQSCSRR